MSKSAFARLMTAENTSLIVVTTAADEVPAGCLVSYHTQASMTPQHYNFWLSKANHTYRVGLLATHFAVHFLTNDDLNLAHHFGAHSRSEERRVGKECRARRWQCDYIEKRELLIV